jgi:hypothetical protein
MLEWGHQKECRQLTTGKCLIAPWSHLTLTSKCSGVFLMKAENHQLNKYFEGLEMKGEFSNKNRRYPFLATTVWIVPVIESQ